MKRRSRLALLAAILGGLAVLDAVLGPALVHLGALRPMVGFYLFLASAVEALVGVVLGIAALIVTRGGRLGGRGLAVAGTLASVAILALVMMGSAPGRGLPRINDITTDVDDPPEFRSALRHKENAGRDFEYPDFFGTLVREAYPDLAPIEVPEEPAEALVRVQETAEALGWNVIEIRHVLFELEANQTSRVFQFVDDIVVRVRPSGISGSIVDVRSKSRDGQGDVGANAARIRTFRTALLN